MTNLTKREIVLEIYRKSGFPQKQIVDTVQQSLDIIQKALANGRNVELRNFGVLEVQLRKQRIGRNPNKPDAEVVIPQRAVVKFKSGKVLKQQLQKINLTTLGRRTRSATAQGDAAESDAGDAPKGNEEIKETDGTSLGAHPLRKNVEEPEKPATRRK